MTKIKGKKLTAEQFDLVGQDMKYGRLGNKIKTISISLAKIAFGSFVMIWMVLLNYLFFVWLFSVSVWFYFFGALLLWLIFCSWTSGMAFIFGGIGLFLDGFKRW